MGIFKTTIHTRLLVVSMFFTATIFAQAVVPPAQPISWKDNQTAILSKSEGMKRTMFEYNIKTGVMTEAKVANPVARPLKMSLKPEDKNPTISPDSTKIAFTRNNDLYSIDIKSGKETRYTFDGSDLILNGKASWVYYEEIFGRSSNYRAFWWSPDSKKLAFYRFDDSKVPMFPIYNPVGKHGSITETRYPKAGDPNPKVKIGIVSVDGGDIVWSDFDQDNDQYFGTPYWHLNNGTLLVQWMDREQSNLVMYSVNAQDGTKREIYKEFQKTWIDWIEDIKFGKDGFYFIRDFDLWEQIYYQTYDGNKLVKLTDGKNWGTKIIKIEEATNTIFYTSRCDVSTRNDVYSLKWNNKYSKEIKKLSSGEFNYSGVIVSPDNKHYLAIISNISTPGKLVLMSSVKGGVVKPGEIRIIEESKRSEPDFSNLPTSEIIFITTPDGYKLPASVTWPKNMDKTKKYPVLISIYGGPNSTMVMDSWRTPGKSTQMWSDEGVIQISLDNRASGHCGKEGINFVHRNLGAYEIQDYILWVKYLRALPFIDDKKIGITGFSYGGTMVVLALTEGSDYFSYGIAGGGVYDWTLYDSHYTERYMDHPDNNPEGYKNSAVLNKVDKYKGVQGSLLYLTHGTGDDNVHMQNTMQLIDALQKAGKHFELMLYPGGMHGYRGYQGAHSASEDIRFWRKTLLDK
ncbi:MAG: DPP IV N-terminal domain-containing protein [Bacteroidales bacterium]